MDGDEKGLLCCESFGGGVSFAVIDNQFSSADVPVSVGGYYPLDSAVLACDRRTSDKAASEAQILEHCWSLSRLIIKCAEQKNFQYTRTSTRRPVDRLQ